MVCKSDAVLDQEARRLLNAIFGRMAQLPEPTGISIYKPQPSDVIVSTYPKSGTTLLQNMVYQIAVATGGAPPSDPDGTNFRDICEVAPWIDYGPQFGLLEGETSPRIFKTHGGAQKFDLTKATYIYCIRDPEQYAASWLDFLFDILLNEEVKDQKVREKVFHLFVRQRVLGFNEDESTTHNSKEDESTPIQPGPWFVHVKDWIDTPRVNILIMFYEDIVHDLHGTTLCVARFMNRTLSPEAVETIVKRCDRKAMAGNPKFNCHIEARAFGFSGIAEKAKNENRPGFKQFNVKEQDKETLSKMMKLTFGVDSYEKFRNVIRQRQQDSFPTRAYIPLDQKGSRENSTEGNRSTS